MAHGLVDLPPDAQVTRSDQSAPVMTLDPRTGLMVPNAALPAAEQRRYDDLEQQSQDRIRAAAAARAASSAGRP